MSKWLTAGVTVRHPGGHRVFLVAGSELPGWATGLVDDHVLTSRGSVISTAEELAPAKADDPVVNASAEPPPRHGGGSGRGPWAEYATKHGVHVDPDYTRADIITACELAGLAT